MLRELDVDAPSPITHALGIYWPLALSRFRRISQLPLLPFAESTFARLRLWSETVTADIVGCVPPQLFSRKFL
jgi:hypothetical protein